MTEWAQNDALFFRELREGHAWQMLPALYFRLRGLKVEMPALTVRESIEDAGRWRNSFDLRVNGHVIEVKSRGETFFDRFPYESVIVDTVAGYRAKDPKPTAYLMISRPTGAMVGPRSGHGRHGARWIAAGGKGVKCRTTNTWFSGPKTLKTTH